MRSNLQVTEQLYMIRSAKKERIKKTEIYYGRNNEIVYVFYMNRSQFDSSIMSVLFIEFLKISSVQLR